MIFEWPNKSMIYFIIASIKIHCKSKHCISIYKNLQEPTVNTKFFNFSMTSVTFNSMTFQSLEGENKIHDFIGCIDLTHEALYTFTWQAWTITSDLHTWHQMLKSQFFLLLLIKPSKIWPRRFAEKVDVHTYNTKRCFSLTSVCTMSLSLLDSLTVHYLFTVLRFTYIYCPGK